MKILSLVLISLTILSCVYTAIITGACNRDRECRQGHCCAASLWLRGLRVCTPMGEEGDKCHPLSRKVPYFGERRHHLCPCLPNLACINLSNGQYKCSPAFNYEGIKIEDVHPVVLLSLLVALNESLFRDGDDRAHLTAQRVDFREQLSRADKEDFQVKFSVFAELVNLAMEVLAGMLLLSMP
ncbi:AVIToxin-VAR1-like [Callorhinchus milii]|uniref:AVIToxin-VAR1-like n=1 Tax=Callorhinchus milii TaxID=7868 RepID=UPI001C3F61BC|nr:AVIToxin-VAR1-like [Callorhinchus milii]